MTSLRIEERHLEDGDPGSGRRSGQEMEMVEAEMPDRASTVGREPLLSTTVKQSVSLLDDVAQEGRGPTAPVGGANEGDSLSKSEDTQSANIKQSKYAVEEGEMDQPGREHKYQQCSTSTQAIEGQENQVYEEQILRPNGRNQPTVQQKVVEQQILAEVEVRNQYNFATEGTPPGENLQAIMENDLRKDQLRTQNFSKSR